MGRFGVVCVVIAIVLACLAIGPLVFMLAWNGCVPAMFHGGEIGFWTAFAAIWLLGSMGLAFGGPMKASS